MGSLDNRFRRKWQDYGGSKATNAEHSFIEVFSELFKDTEYEVVSQPTDFKNLYVDVVLSEEELAAIYTPDEPIKKHGIQPDGAIRNTRTGKTIYVEIKRQDGWVEGKPRSAGRGNAHERLCKYFTPVFLVNFVLKAGFQNQTFLFGLYSRVILQETHVEFEKSPIGSRISRPITSFGETAQ